MIKRDLLKLLEGVVETAEIVLALDSGGNDFSPLAGSNAGYYIPCNAWSGDYYPHPNEDPEYYGSQEEGWRQMDEMPEKKFCIVLWPTS